MAEIRTNVLADRDPSRVDWMELVFDLVFVALVGQLAHGLHSEPTITSLLVFLGLFASVWWSWVNLALAVNVMPQLTRRQLASIMLTAMLAVGAVAVAAPEAIGDRAWLFAAGNATLRLVLLVLWVRRSWANGVTSRTRVIAYNGATAVLWFVSIWLPHPVDYLLWAAIILFEVLLLVLSGRSWADLALGAMNVEHLSERFGLLVIIVLGESVLSTVASVDHSWGLPSGITAILGLMIVAGLAWSFFMFSIDRLRTGLEKLQKSGNFAAIRDTVAFLPFLLLSGVTAISGALAIAMEHPERALPLASSVSLGGGIALFYITNAIISLRFGDHRPGVLRWSFPPVLLTLALTLAGLLLPAIATTAVGAAIVPGVVASAERTRRRHTTTQFR